MKKQHILIILLFALTLLLAGCVTHVGDGPDFTPINAVGAAIGSVGRGISAAGDPVVEICGIVSDDQCNPVSGAKVRGSYENGRRYWFTIKTDENGEFRHKVKASAFRMISVSREGYRSYLAEHWGDQYWTKDIKYDKERKMRSNYSKPLAFELRKKEPVEYGRNQS